MLSQPPPPTAEAVLAPAEPPSPGTFMADSNRSECNGLTPAERESFRHLAMDIASPTPTPAQADAVPEAQSDDCNVICPYCGYAYQAEAQDFQDREREEQCGQCERTYLLYDDMTVTHYTRPLPSKP